jgi:hypothetical protein
VTGNPANFGKAGAATIVNPDVLHGWGVRPNDYQSTFTVQHEIIRAFQPKSATPTGRSMASSSPTTSLDPAHRGSTRRIR